MFSRSTPALVLLCALCAGSVGACGSDGATGGRSGGGEGDGGGEDVGDGSGRGDDAGVDAVGEVGEDAAVDGDVADSGTDASADCVEPDGVGLVPARFIQGGLVTAITEEACVLDNGEASTCYRIETRGAPSDHAVGPFCPRSIDDGADEGGIWLESGVVYDVDGAFIAGLADFYGDPNWLLYDPDTGAVNVTDSREACEAAARPDVDPAYQNFCVECALDYVDGGVSDSFLIPTLPVPRDSAAEIGNAVSVGVALNGVRFDPPAPVNAILAAYTIAAFDDCGGHVNLVHGYHYHAATGCSTQVAHCDQHAPLIGYALDGYAIHAMTAADGAEPGDLDDCRGHTDAERGYHYHAAGPGENLFIGCFHGHTVDTGDQGGPGPGGTDPIACDQVPAGAPCCGDTVCDGPETASNCAEDC